MGLEYITQPQVFLAPITAVNGIQGINNPYPLLTTYQSWVSTGVVNTSAFPIPGAWTMLDAPGSFIVTVGNVIQSPTDYSIDRVNRILTFSSVVTAGIEVGVTQLATASPSAVSYKALTAENLFVFDTAFINNVSLSSGSIVGSGNETVFSDSNNIASGNGSNTLTLNYQNGVFVSNNFTAASVIRCSSLTATNASVTTLTATNTDTASLSSRFINLEHSIPNDGINPVLFIGERGNGSSGTVAGSLSGFNTTYNELNNSLIVSTQFGAVAPLTAVAISSNTNVGIGTALPNQRLTVIGSISASGELTTTSLSSRFINLEHTTPNDGINPVLFIGERGNGSGGTVAGSLSGFNISYSEPSNDLLITTQFGAVAPLTAVDINSNGQVGINCNPNQALTVTGNISATGDLFSNSGLLSFGGANTTTASPGQIFYGTNSDIVLDANSRYEIIFDLYYSKTTATTAIYALSGNTTFTNIVANYIQQPALGIANNGATTGAGVVAQTAALIALPATASLTTGVNHYATIKAVVETSAANRLNLSVWNGAAGTITPLRGSYWVKRRIN